MFSTIIAFLSTLGFYSLIPVAGNANKETCKIWKQGDIVYITLDNVLYSFYKDKHFIACRVGKNKPTHWAPSEENAIAKAKTATTPDHKNGARMALKLMDISPFVIWSI